MADPDVIPRSAAEMIAETRALNEAGKAVESKQTDAAIRLVRNLYASRRSCTSVEDTITLAAMAKILGDSVEPHINPIPTEGPWDKIVLETVAHVWISCMAGRPEVARRLLPEIRAKQHEDEGIEGRKGAVNLMSMYYWTIAVEALANGDRKEAKRFWKRALEVGSHFGTDSHMIVSWTYVATFFPTH